MAGFFDNVSSGEMSAGEVNELQKALAAGYGTDSSQFTGGRALIPENLESEVVNVVAQLKEDCKVMNSVKKTPVRSTVHEVNLRTGHGDYRHLSVAEGGASIDTDQSLERKTFAMKYLQTRRSVTKQMEAAETFEGALASEKLAGVETIIKGAEYQCFHGDSSIVPTEFDGFLASIKKANAADKNIINLKGSTLGNYGEKIFDEIAAMVRGKGGFLDKALFPTVLAKDIKEIFADKQRYLMNNPIPNLSFKTIPDYGTAIGANIALSGEEAGDDMFFEVKGEVVAEGDATRRPAAPASVTASASGSGSSFTANDAGDYMYTVHAVNQYGISAGTSIAAAVTVAAGNKVALTITPGSGVAATGFIICRSKKDDTKVMEMDKVANSGNATTVYEDTNDELPGTASMIFLPKKRFQPVYTFGQLLPACTFPLAPTNTAETPFLVMLYGGLEVRAPKHCGLVKNISYNGGLY
jgi:hypothetical protein